MTSDRKSITVEAVSCCRLKALKGVETLQLLGNCMLTKTGSLLHNTYKFELDSTSYEQFVCVMYMFAVHG